MCPIANNNQLGGRAVGVDFAIVFDKTIVIVEIVSANEAIAINIAIAVDRVNTNICRLLLIDGIAIVLYLVFSLMKYSVIFTEVEGDFEKNNNQLGTVEVRSHKAAKDLGFQQSTEVRSWQKVPS